MKASEIDPNEEITEKISELEKENAELKEQLKNLKGENEVLYSANKQLNSLIKIKDECAKEYIEQIGKMQNVGNCKHAMDCAKFNEKELIYGKLRTCKNCKDWELAE